MWYIILYNIGQKYRAWVLGTLIYDGVKLERREDRFESILNIHTIPLCHTGFLFGTVQLTSQKNLGICPPPTS